MRVLLISNSTQHGSGYLEHCAGEVQDFLAGCERVAFVPYALFDHDDYAMAVKAAFKGMGFDVRSTHASDSPVAALDDADAIFVGGGNTFRLLNKLYETDLLTAIRDRVRDGMPYMGASAGSNVACASLRTTNDMPIVQPPSFEAMALLPFNLNPHYLDPTPGSRHMGETRETRIREFHEENDQPVVGLREGGLLRVEDDTMTLKGSAGARVFRRHAEPQEFEPGADMSELLQG
ncbi:MAG: dipeptidase PepE [Planctomycetota bacterium]